MKKRTTKPHLTKPTPAKEGRVRAKALPSAATGRSARDRHKLNSAYFASFVEASDDAIVTVSLDAHFQSWNPGAQRLFGYTPAEVIGKHVSILMPKDRLAEFRRNHAALTRGERLPRFETVRRRKDGTLIEVEWSVSPIMRNNRPVAIMALGRDISGVKRAERELRESEARLRAIFDQTASGIVQADLKGRIIFANPRFCETIGYSAAELLERTMRDVTHPDDLASSLAHFRKTAAEGTGFDIEKRYLHKDGSIVWVHNSVSAIVDAAGKPQSILAVSVDITSRKLAQEALHVSEERFRLALRNTRLTVFNQDRDLRHTWIYNPHPHFRPEDIVGKTDADLLPPEYAARLTALKRRVLETGVGTREEVSGLIDGVLCWWDLTLEPRRNATGEIIGITGAALDITERKRVENTLRASEERFRRYFELGLIGMAITSPTKGWVEVNDQMCETLGYERSELVKLTWAELTHPDDLAADLANFNRVLAGEIDGYSMEKRFIRKDGEVIHSTLSVKCLRCADGSVDDFLALVQDITARKRVKEALRQSHDLLAKLSRQVPGVIYQFRLFPDGRSCFPYASEGIWEMYEVTPEQVREDGSAVFAILHPDDYAGIVASIEESARTLKPWHYEYRVVLPKQGVRWRLGDSRPERLADGSTLWHGFITDVTGRKQVEEELRQLNAELEDRVARRTASLMTSTESLLASITALRQAKEDRRRLENEIIGISESERERIGQDLHDDLGQQLAGLRWLSSALEKNLKTRSAPETSAAARITELLNKALALTRNLARGLHPVPSEPDGLMAALDEISAHSSDLFGVRCRFTCRQPVHIWNPIAATHLYRIAQEAVTNAIKHGKAGHIQITLSSSRGKILLSLADDGTGFKEPGGENGIGVRIMNYRAETLGGSLVIRNRSNGGTRVLCTIPIPAEPDAIGKNTSATK